MAFASDEWFDTLVIVLTLLVAFVFAIVALPEFVPDMLGYLRPDWILLVLIYWTLTLPQKVGFFWAWMIGMMVDVLYGGLMGQHSISFVLVGYIVLSQYQRLRMVSAMQQSLAIFVLVLINQLTNLWIESMTSDVDFSLLYFMPSVASGLMWPVIYLVLGNVRQKYGAR